MLATACNVFLGIYTGIEHDSNSQRTPNRSIFQQLDLVSGFRTPGRERLYLERNHRVWTPPLPYYEGWNAEHSNDKRSNDLGCLPLRHGASGNRERNEDQSQDGNQEQNANHIQVPEQVDEKFANSLVQEGELIGLGVGSASLEVAHEEDSEQWNGADGVDDGEHSDTPLPRGHFQDGGGDVTADPGVNLPL